MKLIAAVALACLALLPAPRVAAQRAQSLALTGPSGAQGVAIPLAYHRGYAVFPLGALRRIGWTVDVGQGPATATRADDRIELKERSPFFRWSDTVLQLTADPYRFGDDFWVPVELLVDFLPTHRSEELAFHGDAPSLEVKLADAWTPETAARLARESVAPAVVAAPSPELRSGSRPTVAPPPPAAARTTPSSASPTRSGGAPARSAPAARVQAAVRPRLVVIDAGHGGEDPGARGPRGIQEKDVALKVALALARELERDPDLEVHLTRTSDRLVPLWERGEWATSFKKERPGVFISLHANAETSRLASGFETYFLSEARTEHERRVAALENEPFLQGPGAAAASADPELTGIVQELRTLDDQHWSSLLAELVQEELGRHVHPGPNRGVKQGPLAVITNTLMPAVLVEVGFISNRAEERLLDTPKFQAAAAKAIAQAVARFFERYPPGGPAPSGTGR